ncbi:T9SS type B sorting domain-containing protein [Wenyingzhuangia sp. IMCC45574]
MQKSLLLFLFCIISLSGFSQLDDTHYFPPLTQEGNNSINQQSFYLSTPETTPFDVTVYKGNSTTPLKVLTGLSNTSSIRYDLTDGTNNISIVDEFHVGVVINDGGLRFVAENGEKFYTNYRSKSGAQAGSLTCKGKRALGTDFRWGGIPSVTSSTAPAAYNAACIMASEDNTTVTISGFDPNCTFRSRSNENGLSDDVIQITLNAHESFILEAVLAPSKPANFNGWLGANILSNNPIAVSSVGLTGLSGNSRDVTMDQIVSLDVLGKEYGFIRGNGADASEFPLIIATEDNTRVSVNGVFYQTINNGESLQIPGNLYSGSVAGTNLFVATNKKVYAFQCLTGEAGKIQTIGMNFIPPLVCLLPTSFDYISDIDDIAGNPSDASAITLITATTSPDSEIKVYQNNIEISKPTSLNFNGTSEWKSFFIDNLTGDIKVESPGNIVVGFFVNDGGNAGYAGYFSGFDEVPETDVGLAIKGECLPDGELKLVDTLQTSYQWYKNGVEITGATSYKVQMDGVGEYYADIFTKTGCVYRSESIDITDPNREILFNNCTLKTKDSLQEAYQWYRNDTLLVGETKFTTVPVIQGIYHAEMTTKTGCIYKTNKHKTLFDVATPEIDTTYVGTGCISDGVIKLFKNDPTNYYTYQWYKDGSIIPLENTKEYMVSTTGEYFVDITNPGGCTITSDTITIEHPNLNLERDLSYGCAPNGNIKAVDSLQGTYNWFRNGKAILGSSNFKINLDSIGSYYADIITHYGCTYRSDTLDVIHCYDLEINKTADKTEILEGGDDLTYSITILNKGYLPVTDLKIADIIPNKLIFKSFVASIGTWGAPYWEIAKLDSGAMASLTLNTTSLVDNLDTEITNTITSTQNEVDSNHSPDDLSETVDILNGQIEINAVSAALVRPFRIIKGDILNFTFSIRNIGEIPLSNIQLTNNLFPVELNANFVSGDTNNNNVLDFNETWIYAAPYAITQEQINNLEVVSTTFVNGLQPNTFTQYHQLDYTYPIDPEYVVPYIDLEINVTGNGPNIYIEDDVNIQLKLSSDNTAKTKDIVIAALLPSGLEYQDYSSKEGTYDPDTGNWNIDLLEKNNTATINLKAKMLFDGDHTFTATIADAFSIDSILPNNTASISFKPICYQVFNEFSPNNDGINDKLVVQCSEYTDQISLKIFNRNGALVFQSNNYKNEFDGRGNTGIYINKNKKLPNGTYFYIINSKDGSGEKNGWIYINR